MFENNSRRTISYRNLNTIRAIARQHGDPVDRATFMALYAQRCIYTGQKFSIMQKIKWFILRVKFDLHLFKMKMQFWFIRTYIDALAYLGRSSANSDKLLSFNEETN